MGFLFFFLIKVKLLAWESLGFQVCFSGHYVVPSDRNTCLLRLLFELLLIFLGLFMLMGHEVDNSLQQKFTVKSDNFPVSNSEQLPMSSFSY